MDIDGVRAHIVRDEVFFDLADSANRALKDLLDEDALLRVHNLIVALLKFAVDLNVLDVENSIMGETFLEAPLLRVLFNGKIKRVKLYSNKCALANNCCHDLPRFHARFYRWGRARL